jgi:hypothetical protein
VGFNVPELDIMAGSFPAKSVTYDRFAVKSTNLPIAPGETLDLIVGTSFIKTVSITFYEDQNNSIGKFFEEYFETMNKDGYNKDKNLILTIEEFQRDDKTIRSVDEFIVQPNFNYTRLLENEGAAYELPGVFTVIGRNQ